MALLSVTEANFEKEILRSQVPVLVEFGAEWCAPCKTVAPEVNALAQELGDKAKVVTIDIDRAPIIAQQMGIQSVPTFVVFHQGRPVDGKTGVLRRNELRAMLEPFLPRAAGALKAPEVVQLLRRGQISLVDAREAPVFARNRIGGASNIPADELESRLAELHMLPGAPVIYCRAGDKTKEIAGRLAEQGVPVSFLEGGVLAWEAAGFTLERPD